MTLPRNSTKQLRTIGFWKTAAKTRRCDRVHSTTLQRADRTVLPGPPRHVFVVHFFCPRSCTRLLQQRRSAVPTQQFEIRHFDIRGDFLPLILLFNPFSRSFTGGFSQRWIGYQEPQAIRQILRIPPLERKARSIDYFAVLWN